MADGTVLYGTIGSCEEADKMVTCLATSGHSNMEDSAS
ncbi:hypothetical protein CCACVL1_12046 [Corchorus capsularis]|uniref:Uncharacterized protein n=1 Tax=Corchorus capsularis TaxID=210143 RepID=A0A1R3IHV2_COCAP|nr:hypothetical protein CCACVL1_12046 [Corchorus capsularis]